MNEDLRCSLLLIHHQGLNGACKFGYHTHTFSDEGACGYGKHLPFSSREQGLSVSPDQLQNNVYGTAQTFLPHWRRGSYPFAVTVMVRKYQMSRQTSWNESDYGPIVLKFPKGRGISLESVKSKDRFRASVTNSKQSTLRRTSSDFTADRSTRTRLGYSRTDEERKGQGACTHRRDCLLLLPHPAFSLITWKAAGYRRALWPKVLPMEAKRYPTIDVRIYKLDPKDVRFSGVSLLSLSLE